LAVAQRLVGAASWADARERRPRLHGAILSKPPADRDGEPAYRLQLDSRFAPVELRFCGEVEIIRALAARRLASVA